MSNLKKYNVFVFINSFAKSLMEVFVVIILYNKGFNIEKILLFLLFKHVFCILILPIYRLLSKILSYSKLMILSSLIYLIAFYYLNVLESGILSLLMLSIILAMYSDFYWIGRHIYALSIIEEKKTTDNVFLYEMFGLFGRAFATYIGAYTLTKYNYNYTLIVVFILLVISIVPLIKMDKNIIKPEGTIWHIFKTFPIRNTIFDSLDQVRNLSIYLFPLYVYLFIKSDFKYIGLLNLVCTLGSIIYLYILSKKMDKNKKDYLKISSIFLALVFFFRITIKQNILYLIVIFIEGFFKSSMQAITTRNNYAYSKNYNLVTYVYYNEYFVNSIKVIILLFFYLLNFDLKSIIVLSIITMVINSFIGYDDGKYGYSKC